MPAPITTGKELARQAWTTLPHDKRSANDIIAAMKRAGIEDTPSKGSINRWKAEWEKTVPATAERFMPAVKMAPVKVVAKANLTDVPQSLRDVLGDRLLFFARGEGLDRVEEAVIALSGAIADKSSEIAAMLLDTGTEQIEVTKDGENETTKKTVEKAAIARSAVACVAQLASAMHTISNARILPSLAHANLGTERVLHVAGVDAVVPVGLGILLQLREKTRLLFLVVTEREGARDALVDLCIPPGVENDVGERAERQTLTHGLAVDSETQGDRVNVERLLLVGVQRRERAEGVNGVHRGARDVLCERGLARFGVGCLDDHDGHLRVGLDLAGLGELLQRHQALAPGSDKIAGAIEAHPQRV